MLTLSFPVILYLFLRSYGENEFALPVYFEGQEKVYCSDSSTNSSSIVVFDFKQEDTLKVNEVYKANYTVVHFPNIEDAEIQTLKNELNRVLNTFDDLSINIVSLLKTENANTDSVSFSSFLPSDRSRTYYYSLQERNLFIDCLYAFPTEQWDGQHPTEETIPTENTLVLLDEEKKIRGYYNGYETKEVDRLILEIRVLLSNR